MKNKTKNKKKKQKIRLKHTNKIQSMTVPCRKYFVIWHYYDDTYYKSEIPMKIYSLNTRRSMSDLIFMEAYTNGRYFADKIFACIPFLNVN